MKRIGKILLLVLLLLMVSGPVLCWAGGGAKGAELVVVADTRVIDSGVMKYIANLYNTNVTLFATWAVVLTAVYGCLLGFLMDAIMSRTGLDLTSRKIVEH